MEINIIVRNEDNFVKNVIKLKYDSKKYNDLAGMSNYLKEKYNKQCMFYECEYDLECKKLYLYYLAKKNNKLDLDINFTELSFDDYYRIVKNNKLTINTLIVGGGCGGFSELFGILGFILTLWDFFNKIVNFIKGFFVYLFPFYNILKKYGYGKHFIYDIINYDEQWNYGFLKLEKIPFNKLLERSIMHKFGYRLRNKKWEKEIYPDSSKNLNKYEKY